LEEGAMGKASRKEDHQNNRVGLSALIAAIVENACEDYRAALRRQRTNSRQTTYGESMRWENATKRVLECEHFFKSKWFEELVDIDGDMLMDKLRELEAKEAR
jgi:hypothetical protein